MGHLKRAFMKYMAVNVKKKIIMYICIFFIVQAVWKKILTRAAQFTESMDN